MSRAPLKRTRFGAAFLAVAFLAAQMVAFGHQASVRHATCPEHGELVDTTAPGLEPPVLTAAATIAAATVPSQGHEHCSMWSPRREPVGHLGAAPDAALARASHDLPVHAPPPGGFGIAILRLSPKTSPPA